MPTTQFTLRSSFSGGGDAPRDRGARYAGIAGAIVFHLVLIIALLQYTPVRRSLARMAPIMVSVITPPKLEPLPPPPKPPMVRKTAPKEAAPPIEKVVETPPVPSETTAISPITLPAATPPPAQPIGEAVVAPQPPPPVIPPRFNADYLQNPAPAYPALARRMHEQGKVLVRVLVSVEGAPERVELKTSSGSPRLDQSALDTIKNWKFVPARQGDQKVAAWVLVPITFTLEG
jgi:periplasmic protein TonB